MANNNDYDYAGTDELERYDVIGIPITTMADFGYDIPDYDDSYNNDSRWEVGII